METIIEAMHLNKAYNDQVTALLDVNFAIGKGEFVALLGRSGSGKSTLLNILGGLDAPTSGEVWIDGKNVDFSDRKSRSSRSGGRPSGLSSRVSTSSRR